MAARIEQKVRSPRTPRADADATRLRILRVAERLFAEKGIDGVGLSAINEAAGQSNRSAVNYHFGGKDALVEAILATHDADVVRRRHEMVSELSAQGSAELRDWVRTLVMPLAEKLEDPRGVAYLRIVAQVIGHPRFELLERHRAAVLGGSDPLLRTLGRAHRKDPARWLSRWILISGALYHGLADFSRLRDEPDAFPPTPEAFASELVESITALIEAPATAAPGRHSKRRRRS